MRDMQVKSFETISERYQVVRATGYDSNIPILAVFGLCIVLQLHAERSTPMSLKEAFQCIAVRQYRRNIGCFLLLIEQD